MTPLLLLFAFLVPAKPHWVRIKDATAPHMRWENVYGNVLGEYYRLEPGDFVAQCYDSAPASFATETKAREFVLGCEVW